MTAWSQARSIALNLMGTMGVAWKDLVSQEEFLVNPDEIFPAASIIKLHILVECLRQADAGLLSLDEEVRIEKEDQVGGAGVLQALRPGLVLPLRDLAALMIVVSDNTASNLVLRRVGIEAVNRLCRELGLKETVIRRTFMTHPNLPPVNFVTPRETMILLEALHAGRLLSPPLTTMALDILKLQQFDDQIPRRLPLEIPCAHKTGRISGVRHDAGIVFVPDRPYVLVALTKDLAEEEAGVMAIAAVSRVIYQLVLNQERVS